MTATQNLSVTLHCQTCGAAFHPWPGRESTSKFCGLSCRRQPVRDERAEFERRYVVRENGCWEWIGNLNDQGYAIFSCNGKKERASHASLRIFNGIDIGDLEACHKCDNPPCINPDHLFPGTHAQNMADMAAKGRQPGPPPELALRGEKHPLHKITAETAMLIRRCDGRHADIAAKFGVSKSLVQGIKAGTHWKHI